MHTVLSDLRFGVRMLAKNPRFTSFAVLTLGLGIGINAAVFSFLDRALFRPLPVKRPHELAMVGYRTPDDGSLHKYGSFHYPLYAHFRDASAAFSGLMACAGDPVDLTVEESSARAMGAGVSGNYFSVLGVKSAWGRTLSPEDDGPGRSPVAVISDRLWRQEFAGDPDVLGATIRVNDRAFTVVGVTPPEFTGTFAGVNVAVYVPLHAYAEMNGFAVEDPVRTWLMLLGRLRPAVTRSQAEANLCVLAEQFREVEPRNARSRIVLSDGSQGYSVWRDEGIWVVLALFQIPAVLVLVIACANVANMVLARATTRQKEIAIRLGIGASRGALVRQLLCESVLLALLSGACGVLFAWWLSEALRSTVVLTGGIDMPAGVDARILAFTLLASLGTALLFGLAPAFRASRVNVVSMLNEGPGVVELLSRRWSFRNLLVIVQVAGSLIVLVFGALCVRSVEKLSGAATGFDPARILAVAVHPREQGALEERIRPLLEDLAVRAAMWPGVEEVALASEAPLSATGSQKTGVKEIEGVGVMEGQWGISLDYDVVSPGYFSMLGVLMIRGREFSIGDSPGGVPVMIVNQAFARRFWPNQDPIGKRVKCGYGEVREVVGVVKMARLWSLREKPRPTMYWPVAQSPRTKPVLLIRTKGDPKVLSSAVRQALSPLGLNPSECDLRTVDERVSDLLAPQRVIGRGLNILGFLGLLFAAAGIAAVMAYEVSRRTREIGIRVALGARRADIVRMTLLRGLVLTGIGLVLGIGVSAVPAWILCTLLPELREMNDYFLYGVHAWDPMTYAAVSLLLTAAAAVACYLPA
ncbi:MAG: ABC transporter permease, partial [Phycisphaerae bacterium]|nr:ABC transporter permease [Phycisphaerae bacterium]